MIIQTTAEADTLLYTILRAFETLALRQYEAVAPELITEKKRNVVALLDALAPNDHALARAGLDERIKLLLAALTSSERRAVLINQAFLMELVGHTIYTNVLLAPGLCQQTRELCEHGLAASDVSRARTMAALRSEFPNGEAFMDALIALSQPVLKQLDPLSEALDRNFGTAFGLNFGDLIGEFVSEVDEAAKALGADRRKLVGFLTFVMMEA